MQTIIFDMCHDGEPYRKRTRLLCIGIDLYEDCPAVLLREEAHTSERLGPAQGPEDHRHEEWQRSLPCQGGRVVGISCSGGLAIELGAAAFLMNKSCCESWGSCAAAVLWARIMGPPCLIGDLQPGQDHCSRIVVSVHVAAGL